MGWAFTRPDRSCIEVGTVVAQGRDFEARFLDLRRQVTALVERLDPGVVGVEVPYVGVNPQTAIHLAQMVGGIRWLVGDAFVDVSPAQGKMALTGSGGADADAMVGAARLVLLGVYGVDLDVDEHSAHALGVVEYLLAQAILGRFLQ